MMMMVSHSNVVTPLFLSYSDNVDIQVGFELEEYTVNETSSVEVCVEHKSCLQRAVTLEVSQDTLGRRTYNYIIIEIGSYN